MSNRLNILHGVSTIMVLDVSSENTYANAVLPAGIIVRKTDNIFYLTDGTHTIRQLSPIVDQVITSAEKNAIAKAFSNGNYVRAANGMVVHNNLGKIDDSSLNIVDGGKLKVSYLSDFVENNLIKYAKLPDDVKLSFYVVNTYNDLTSLSTEQRKKLIVVKDASGDPTNDITGSGLYYYNNAWISILSVATNTLTYDDVNNLGAVMYDHMIHVTTTNNNIRDVLNKLVIGEVQPQEPSEPDEPDVPTPPAAVVDPVHNDVMDFTENGWEHFVAAYENASTAPQPDLFVPISNDNEFILTLDTVSDSNSKPIDVANAVLTITNTETNYSFTVAFTPSYDNPGIGIGIIDKQSAAYTQFYDGGSSGLNENADVTAVITDGTHTYTRTYTLSNFIYWNQDTITYVMGYDWDAA